MRRLWIVPILLAGFFAGLTIPTGAQVPAGTHQAAARQHTASLSDPGPLAACFGHNGVQFGSFSAWLCEVKLGDDPSGGLYFSPSVDDGLNKANPNGQMLWYKLHAGRGNYYVWENFSQPWGGSGPRSNGRIIALDEGAQRGQCIVVWPDWTVMPTMCFLVRYGGTVVEAAHLMNATERRSVAEYIKNMRAAIPLEYR